MSTHNVCFYELGTDQNGFGEVILNEYPQHVFIEN